MRTMVLGGLVGRMSKRAESRPKMSLRRTAIVILAAGIFSVLPTDAYADHDPSVEVPSRLTFELGDGATVATWIPQRSNPVAYTEYSVNDGAWTQSQDSAHCSADTTSGCDPYAVKIRNPPANTGFSYGLRLRAVGPNDSHGNPAMSEPSSRYDVRNGHASSNRLPVIVSHMGWTDTTVFAIRPEFEYPWIDPTAPVGSPVGSPFLVRDPDGDPVKCRLEDVDERLGEPVFIVSGGTPVAGTQWCQVFLTHPKDPTRPAEQREPRSLNARLILDDGIETSRFKLNGSIPTGPVRGKPEIKGRPKEGSPVTAEATTKAVWGPHPSALTAETSEPGVYHWGFETFDIRWFREDGTEIRYGHRIYAHGCGHRPPPLYDDDDADTR